MINNHTKILNIFKKYWYHAGFWHKAECSSILIDSGVCNCHHSKLKKEILSNLNNI